LSNKNFKQYCSVEGDSQSPFHYVGNDGKVEHSVPNPSFPRNRESPYYENQPLPKPSTPSSVEGDSRSSLHYVGNDGKVFGASRSPFHYVGNDGKVEHSVPNPSFPRNRESPYYENQPLPKPSTPSSVEGASRSPFHYVGNDGKVEVLRRERRLW
jgi:hypothetical protein